MPSASAKIEKVSPAENIEFGKQALHLIEKRIRNLDKRKIKLDNYRNDVQNGKELNEDQKIAVSKYDSVISVLDFAAELSKSLNTLITDTNRQQKKQAKKEQIERQQHEIQRLQEGFVYHHILSSFQNEDVRIDFLNGANGAVQLTSEQLSQLDQLHKLMATEVPNAQVDYINHFHVLAENLIFLVEGKNKEIAGTTYKALRDLLHSIKESGYFSRPADSPEDEVSSEDMQEEEALVEKMDNAQISTETPEIVETQSNDNFDTPEETACTTSTMVPEEKNTAEVTLTAQNGPLQEVLATQSGTFNFLQESQIDLGAPHMDPAVVAVHQIAPPQPVNFSMNSYQQSPPREEATPHLVNGNESPEVPAPAVAPVSQVSAVPSSLPRSGPPVLTSVQHDFDPSHPIPTQTFTNQNFAVMQNMIMPQAYVPVTMHHGPLPHHIAPIAMVPAPMTSTTPVVPMHMPVNAPIQDNGTSIAGDAKPEIIDPQPPIENDAEINPNSNDVIEKGNENGYNQHRGYRGRGRGRGNNGYFRGRNNNYHNGRGGYQNHYYQDRNGYNGNYRRGNNRGRGGNGNRNGRGNYRTQSSQQQSQQQETQQ
ncbi:caprin-1 [Caerostris darwini]|uniref:Caprin-1 n=1 Tax=Caerostris darwini TaxID=1538125 RepID=A0AAV4SKD8_9ARAC|nr:caprin-1 [Caerostris darwini]